MAGHQSLVYRDNCGFCVVNPKEIRSITLISDRTLLNCYFQLCNFKERGKRCSVSKYLSTYAQTGRVVNLSLRDHTSYQASQKAVVDTSGLI